MSTEREGEERYERAWEQVAQTPGAAVMLAKKSGLDEHVADQVSEAGANEALILLHRQAIGELPIQ